MSIESRSQQYGSIFGDWHIGRKLGSGSNGQSAVFELYRDNEGWREYSALKVISLIEERGQKDAMAPLQRHAYSTAAEQQRNQAEQEVRLMYQVKGKTNIVGYEDYRFFDWSDASGFGTDLLIRMELLSDLRGLLKENKCFAEREIIKIGQDICRALVICHEKKILHRDIKPENIFISEDGDYKLGDFGVSRILSNTSAALASTGIGTPAYSAPEQFIGHYDHRVDIYSLGLVLYELSNRNRLPFATSSYVQQEAIQKRQMGIPLPKPAAISEGLWRVLQKACAYKAADRHLTAQEFLEDLCRVNGTKAPAYPKPVLAPQQPNQTAKANGIGAQYSAPRSNVSIERNATQYAGTGTDMRYNYNGTVFAKTTNFNEEPAPLPPTKRKRRTGFLVGAIAGIAVVLSVAVLFLLKGTHEHIWIDATCTAPRTCEECGETEGNSLGHNWAEATCTNPRICNVCQQTEGTALGHLWIEATYETPKTCNVCGTFEGEALVRPWIYINELTYIDNFGKVWIMCAENPGYTADSDITDRNAYTDYRTPGYVTGPVCDYLGNEFTYGLCVDGLDYLEYSIT